MQLSRIFSHLKCVIFLHSDFAAVDSNHVYLKRPGANAFRQGDVGNSLLEIVSLSKDGNWIAVAAADRLSIWRLEDSATSPREILLPSVPLSVQWSNDHNWLACGLQSGGLCLVDMVENQSSIVTDFPGPVRTMGWSMSANALVASGAFRIVAWSMDSPPLAGNAAGALMTGRLGFVVVEAVSAHPKNNLVAAGYANGQIVVSRIGAADQLLVRPSGASVTALVWSADGKHLAVGDADGNAAIVTLPAQLFK
jgi:WD40 repeat protein